MTDVICAVDTDAVPRREPVRPAAGGVDGDLVAAWPEFVPFLAFDPEIRTVVCSTNAIESVNARIRRAVRARGDFPNEAAASRSSKPFGWFSENLERPRGRVTRLS